MQNFVFHNPVQIVFGKETIARLPKLVPAEGRIMVTWGGGSIKKNKVHDQVMKALKGRDVVEFSGIEPNPQYSTLMKAVEIVKKNDIKFLLAVGGGSVLDGTKFIAAAAVYPGAEPWDILEKGERLKSALPIGAVLTLPATGSEMNTNAVISRAETRQKLGFGDRHLYPQFAVLDPETTYTLPPRQTANGIVDTMVHVFEQYTTKDLKATLVEGLAETVLRTTVDYGRVVLERPNDYEARANLMWASTLALNGLIGISAAHDWTSHIIGHELTAFHGLDHGQSLAVVWPNVARYKSAEKRAMLVKYARNVWRIEEKDPAKAAALGIDATVRFWNEIGVKTTLKDYGVGDEMFETIADRLGGSGNMLGENGDIGRDDVIKILRMSLY